MYIAENSKEKSKRENEIEGREVFHSVWCRIWCELAEHKRYVQDKSVIYVANTRLSVIKSHTLCPFGNELNRREHVFNCHLTVMNVSDQPSMEQKRSYQK